MAASPGRWLLVHVRAADPINVYVFIVLSTDSQGQAMDFFAMVPAVDRH